MKPFIYLSVLLIVAGSAFGLSDYFKAKKDGTLSKLYRDDAPELPVTVAKPAIPVNSTTTVSTETKVLAATNTNTAKTVAVKKTKKEAKPRKLSFKMFSRGDEIERFSPPPVIEEPALETPVAVPVAEKPVIEEQPEVKAPQPAKVTVKESKPSITRLFSRARPPKLKKVEVKTTPE